MLPIFQNSHSQDSKGIAPKTLKLPTFWAFKPCWPLPYTPLYSLNSLNSLPLAWDITDRVGHPDRDRTMDTTPQRAKSLLSSESSEGVAESLLSSESSGVSSKSNVAAILKVIGENAFWAF